MKVLFFRHLYEVLWESLHSTYIILSSFCREVYLYLEAKRFYDIGGWTIDAQFRQLMGSTYLLATGIGQPVADAKTKRANNRSKQV